MSMDDRTNLAAQLYTFHYATPSERKNWRFYLSPKQAFKAADHFLAEAKRQAANYSGMPNLGGVTTSEAPFCPFADPHPPEPATSTVEAKCEHLWGDRNFVDSLHCGLCGETRPTDKVEVKEKSKRVAREIEVTYLADNEPIVRFTRGSNFPEFNKRYIYREILPEE